MIRALIADPDLPRLSLADQPDEVRPCLSCNQGCQVRTVMNTPLSCNVNPGAMIPLRNLATTANKRNATQPVLVIGGGPAGMEAARTAALRGKHVILYEREQ